MKYKWIALICVLALMLSITACAEEEEKTTTVTGMVVSVEGTVISLMETDGTMDKMNFEEGERPSMSFNREDFEGFEGGEFPSGEFPGGEFEPPEGQEFPQWGDGEMPEMPEGMTPPENGEMPDFSGENMRPDFNNFDADAETKDVDIGDAHISVEIDGGKASGTLEDITPGCFVTITMNSDGEVTNVLVSSGFRGYRGN